MPPRQKLRAVATGESPPAARRAKTITEAAAAGNQLELLIALRERVARAVEDPNCPPRDLASLSRRLQEINRDIEAIVARERQEAAEDASSQPDEAWDAEAL